MFAVGRHRAKRDLHSADVAPVRQVHVCRPIAVDIFGAHRQAVLRVDPQRFRFAAVGADIDVPGAAAVDRTEAGETHVVRRVHERARFDEVIGARVAQQYAGQFLHVAVAAAPDAVADAQRRFLTRAEAVVVALAVARAPGVKRAVETYAADRTARLDRIDRHAVRGAIVGGQNRFDRRRSAGRVRCGRGPARERDQRCGEKNAATAGCGSVRASRGRFGRSSASRHTGAHHRIFQLRSGRHCRRRRPSGVSPLKRSSRPRR